MRLDKFLSTIGVLSRRESSDAIRHKKITVNGEAVKGGAVQIDPERDVIAYVGHVLTWKRNFYLMLNKPEGTVSSTEDSERTVMKLLPPEYERAGCFPCGRLDIDTVGLLLITNDGDMAHMLLSPRRHVAKSYRFRCSEPLTDDMIASLETGVDLGDFITAPAILEMDTPTEGVISISEGKFHQIKRMLASVGSGIEYLERINFGPLKLDTGLDRGKWRELTEEELDSLRKCIGADAAE